MRRALRLTGLHLRLLTRTANQWVWLIAPLGSILAICMIYSLFSQIVRLPAFFGPRDLVPTMTGALNALLLMMLSASFGAAFTYLYLSRDMPLLLASPVRPRYVILSKILEVAVTGSAPFIIIAVPAFAAVGVAWYAQPWFYPLVLVASLPLIVIPALAAVLLNLVVSRLLPPHRTKELLAAMSTILAAIFYIVMRFAGSVQGLPSRAEEASALLGRWGPSWSPATLFSRAVAEGLLDKPLPLAVTGILLMIASVAAFRLVAPWTERAYVSGWASYGEGRASRKQAAYRRLEAECEGPAAVSTGTRGESPWRQFFGTMELSFRVESRLLFRDLQAQSQVLYLLAMVMSWVLFPSRGSGGPSIVTPWATMGMFLTLSGSYSSWSLRNASATSRILRASPSDPMRVMTGKALFYGVVQAMCLMSIFVVLLLTGKAAGGLRPAFLMITLTLSFSTAAVTICGVSSAPQIVSETGMPKMALGTGFVIFLVNGALTLTGILATMWVEKALMNGRFAEAAVVVAVFLAAQIGAFRSAMQLSRSYVLGTNGQEGGAV